MRSTSTSWPTSSRSPPPRQVQTTAFTCSPRGCRPGPWGGGSPQGPVRGPSAFLDVIPHPLSHRRFSTQLPKKSCFWRFRLLLGFFFFAFIIANLIIFVRFYQKNENIFKSCTKTDALLGWFCIVSLCIRKWNFPL